MSLTKYLNLLVVYILLSRYDNRLLVDSLVAGWLLISVPFNYGLPHSELRVPSTQNHKFSINFAPHLATVSLRLAVKAAEYEYLRSEMKSG